MRLLLVVPALIVCFSTDLGAQMMSPESRENIHTLLDNHASIRRTVTLTDDGYVSTTESSDSSVARALREHVTQMEKRLESGLMVRRWDPAFAEYVQHWDDIVHFMVPTNGGLSMTVHGKTPEAIKVAQNHAEIVTDFVTNGWEGHNRTHPSVLEGAEAAEGEACCGGKGCPKHTHGEEGHGRRMRGGRGLP